MSLYKYIRNSWRNPTEEFNQLWKQRMIEWRKEDATVRVEKPTRLDRARSLGYKAKPGFIIVRQRLMRGARMRPKHIMKGGRRPKHNRRLLVLDKNYQQVAEERAADKYPNCEVLNSYFLAKDGIYYFFEVILVDKANPSVTADKNIKWISESQHTGRVYRGLTSAARKSRGLRRKGKGAEKIRPSRRRYFNG